MRWRCASQTAGEMFHRIDWEGVKEERWFSCPARADNKFGMIFFQRKLGAIGVIPHVLSTWGVGEPHQRERDKTNRKCNWVFPGAMQVGQNWEGW